MLGNKDRRAGSVVRAVVIAAVAAVTVPSTASALERPGNDPFYRYAGSTPLAQVAPGTVVATRTKPYRLGGIGTPIKAVQLLYRTTNQQGQPTVNATSVLLPPVGFSTPRLLSYQSAYDSLSPDDQPSYSIAGGKTFGGSVVVAEAAVFVPWLLQGYTVAVPDTEGQTANFAAGPEYGRNTLDGVRAAFASPATKLGSRAKVGLLGYSGGAIATEWAAELAPTYAPDVNARLVGAAMGGVLVAPSHNLHYVDGTPIWAGVIPMAVIGAARSFGIDLKPYLSAYGLKVYKQLEKATIAQVLGFYGGLTWKKMAKPQYATPESVPAYVKVVNQLIMGTGGTPTVPLFIGQGAKGELEGTPGNRPGIGQGDGVMIAGDVRTLARQYCAAGTKVEYREYAGDSHVTALPKWLARANPWLRARWGGAPAAENCASIKPGNSLAPIPEVAE